MIRSARSRPVNRDNVRRDKRRQRAERGYVHTMGGDIQIDSVDGSVEATSMAGDTAVNLTG